MGDLGLQLAILCFLILVNGFLAGSEIALISLRDGQVRQLRRGSRAGRLLADLVQDPNRFLSTVQIGITLAGFLASATAAVTLAESLAPHLAFLGGAADPVAVALITLLLTFVTLVFGELAPKRVAMQRAEQWALVAARPLSVLAFVATPGVWLLSKTTDVLVRLSGVDPHEAKPPLSEEELRDMIVSQHRYSPLERRIISGALRFGARRLQEILRPRGLVFSLPADIPAEEGLRLLVGSGHSRAPVTGPEGMEDLRGIVHMRDLIGAGGIVGQWAHPAVLFSETLGAPDALRQLQAERQQMAVVLNEYQGVEGIITIEDLLEEVVGEIYDEVDRDLIAVERTADGSLVVPGSFPIHDLPDLGVEIPAGPYTTLAGLLQHHLSRLPLRVGDTLALEGWRLEVLQVRGRSPAKVRLSPVAGKQDD